MRALLFITISILFLVGCKTPISNKSNNVTLPFEFSSEVELLDSTKPQVIKLVGDTDKVITTEINWSNELSSFLLFEELYHKNKELYTIDSLLDNFNLEITYTAQKENLAIQSAKYNFYKKKCVRIEFEKASGSSIMQHDQLLVYEPNIGYKIAGRQSIGGLNKFDYQVDATFLFNQWRGTIIGENHEVPFNFTLNENSFIIFNGEEKIIATEINHDNDSIFIQLPYFNSGIIATKRNDSLIGYWQKFSKLDYKLPFFAIQSASRFDYKPVKTPINLTGKWEVTFSPGTSNQWPAIGVFKQKDNYLCGTFLTETGDFRFLEGYINGNELKLSCFDGSHSFLFTALINPEGNLEGTFNAGKSWSESWIAKPNSQAVLQNPYAITQVIGKDSTVDFSFYNMDSVLISVDNERYKNKPIILQLMGSWCPNCMDESKFYSELYNEYSAKGLEIISVCFEPFEEFKKNQALVKKVKKELNIPYEMVIAGRASKKAASDLFPMLSSITSFPTSIFLDKQHKIQKVHTGFYGPGTGPYYENYVAETKAFVNSLLK